MSENLLHIENLSVSFPTRANRNPAPVVDGISFNIGKGEILGLIGNSGSGKTMTAMTIAGLLPSGARINGGTVSMNGVNLLGLPSRERRAMLGSDIAVVFQEPATALDPLMRIGTMLTEILTVHGIKDKEEINKRILSILSVVGFDSPADICTRYPHQISGGQRQRVLIAAAALLRPSLMICDEPTSSLDTVTTKQILALLRELRDKFGMSILFISHDLSAVRGFCDRVAVMHHGRFETVDTAEAVLVNPTNEYTRKLLANSRLDTSALGIKVAVPSYDLPPVLSVKNVNIGYSPEKKIVKDASFEVFPGEVLGIIGSSGCGKTTLASGILGLLPHEGEIVFENGEKSIRPGAVFQDPVSCLNPAHTVAWHLKEALRASHTGTRGDDINKIMEAAMNSVDLSPEYLSRKSSRLSGGQRQKAAIAMCLMTNPPVIIADEPFSSLDATSAAEIIKLLADINHEHGTAIVLITHNIHIVRQLCNRLIVMSHGVIHEQGEVSELLSKPSSDALKKLLDAEFTYSTNHRAYRSVPQSE